MLLNDLFNIDIPIIQAPMAGVQNWELAVAVSNAGAMGSIPCGMLSVEKIKREIKQFTANSDRPYNLNFFCHEMPMVDNDQLSIWEKTLSVYYRELEIPFESNMSGLRMPFNKDVADAIELYSPKAISFHFGLPSLELLDRIKSWGAKVLSSATTVKEGLWLEKNGADIGIAQGYEAGGHRGIFLTNDISSQIGKLSLTSQLLDKLTVPVIAAGGISSHKDVKALFQLGVSGVQVGTSFLLCPETKTSPVHRAALKDGRSVTTITNVFSGRPARGIRNRIMQELGDICSVAPKFPYASIALAPLRQKAEAKMSSDFTPLWSGQNRSGCKEISAVELTKELWDDC
ncbi:MAG: nitronate monooxygenase [Flavobacteriaceae bacterium]